MFTLILYKLGWNDFFIICSYDEACLVLQERPAFLAFEGHKGRKAKKGQKFFFQNDSEWPKMARNVKKKISCYDGFGLCALQS